MSGAPITVGSSLFMLTVGFAGGAAALLTKEYLAPIFHDWRSKKSREREIYRHYVAPLSASCIRLLWRFKELFIDERHHFLLTAAHPLDYNQYKRTSTLYRIASVIGWLRAINLELSALPQGSSRQSGSLSKEIAAFESALADGPHVEAFRLQQVSKLWDLPLDRLSEEESANLAMRFEVELYRLAGDALKRDPALIQEMSNEDRVALCRDLAGFLALRIKVKVPDEALVAETSCRVGISLSYRESWIYRDWQEAIGDAMIEKDDASPRRYKVIGFRDFENVLSLDQKWIRALTYMIEDVDLERADANDFRGDQLRKLARSTAAMVRTISTSRARDLVDTDSRALATQLAGLAVR